MRIMERSRCMLQWSDAVNVHRKYNGSNLLPLHALNWFHNVEFAQWIFSFSIFIKATALGHDDDDGEHKKWALASKKFNQCHWVMCFSWKFSLIYFVLFGICAIKVCYSSYCLYASSCYQGQQTFFFCRWFITSNIFTKCVWIDKREKFNWKLFDDLTKLQYKRIKKIDWVGKV